MKVLLACPLWVAFCSSTNTFSFHFPLGVKLCIYFLASKRLLHCPTGVFSLQSLLRCNSFLYIYVVLIYLFCPLFIYYYLKLPWIFKILRFPVFCRPLVVILWIFILLFLWLPFYFRSLLLTLGFVCIWMQPS